VLSIGIFFTLMIIGLASTLPHALATGLHANGVPAATATRIGHLPPISVLFAAFLGYDPARSLIGTHVLAHLTAAKAAVIEGHSFFPSLVAEPFHSGLDEAFTFAIVICLVAALASWSRGAREPADEQAAQRATA
jgi:hypothetical protein